MERDAYRALRDLQEDHWWFAGRRKVVEALIRARAELPRDAKILEAGCGYGGNLEMLGRFGEVSAFEIDEDARKFASEKAGKPIPYGSLPDKPGYDGQKFDLIVMLDVLEHIDDDLESLKVLRERLAPGGSILVTVPALSWLWSQHDETHHHKRRYRLKQLQQVLADAGLRQVEIGYFNSLLFPLALAQRIVAKITGRDQGQGELPQALNGLFKTAFGYEGKLLRRIRMPIGLSLYAVFENPDV